MKSYSTLRVRRHAPQFAAAVLGIVAFAACGESPTVPAVSASMDAPSMQVISRTSDATWAQQIVGETGPGSTYAMFVPHNWNGDVVYYAHGFTDAAAPIALPNNVDGLRNELGARGYAFAYSSYSENGFAVKDGVQRTHQLRGLFTGATQLRPERSYLIGQSLGGGIVSAIAEDKAAQYDGVMPVCGMVGGSLLQTQYLGKVRTLFDALFTGVLPGTTISMPANIDVNSQIVGPAQAAVFGTADGPAKLVGMLYSPQTPLPVPLPFDFTQQSFGMAFTSLANALGFHARGINDILDRTNGATPFDNADTVYTSLLWSPAVQTGINAVIARYTIAPSAENYLAKNFTPSGDLEIPTLTLHNRYDPVVPEFHEGALQAAVDAAGKSDLLVRRIATVPYGHCVFSAAEVAGNFDLLVNWVENGVKP